MNLRVYRYTRKFNQESSDMMVMKRNFATLTCPGTLMKLAL